MWTSSGVALGPGPVGASSGAHPASASPSISPRKPNRRASKAPHPDQERGAPPLPRTLPLYRSKTVEARRILHKDLAADRRAGGPPPQLVQRQPVIDVIERRDPVERRAGLGGVRVRPIGAPQDALGVGGDQRPRQRRHVIVGGRLV